MAKNGRNMECWSRCILKNVLINIFFTASSVCIYCYFNISENIIIFHSYNTPHPHTHNFSNKLGPSDIGLFSALKFIKLF